MFKKSLISAVILSSTVLATAVTSASNFDYLQAGYSQIDVNELDELNLTGFNVKLNKSLGDKGVFVAASWDRETDSMNGANLTINYYTAGLGYHKNVGKNVDLFGALSYAKGKLSASSGYGSLSTSDNGYQAELGLKFNPTPAITLTGAVNRVKLGDTTDTGYELAGDYFVNKSFSIGLNYRQISDFDITSLNATYHF
jgi:hypothetical protein